MEIGHSTHLAPQPSRPAPAALPRPTVATPAMVGDRFVSTLHPQDSAAAPGAVPEAGQGTNLAQLANLSRLPHMLHLLAPVANVAKGVAGASKAVSVADTVVDAATLTKGASAATKAMAHADHVVDAAMVAKTASGATNAAAHAGHVMDVASKGDFLARLGGPLSAIATGLSAVVAFFDIKKAIATRKDPQATSREKALTTTQAGLSGVSGVAGIVAGLGAAGLALPVSIPALLTVSTVAGLGSFVVSLFNRKGAHVGH